MGRVTFFSFFDRQEQCSVLVDVMKTYQTLKTSISSIIESTEPLIDISSVLKDHEETKRSLTKVGRKLFLHLQNELFNVSLS